MASPKKRTSPKGKKAKAKKPAAAKKAPAPKKPAGPKKILIDPKKLAAMKVAEKKRLEAERAREEKRVKAERERAHKMIEAERARSKREAEKAMDRAQKLAVLAADKARKEAEKVAEKARKDQEKALEKQRKDAEKVALAQKKLEEKAAALKAKEEAKAAAQAAKEEAKLASKKRPIPMSSLAATPIIRPLGAEAVQLAPPPPPAKPGHVDHQMLSALSYGMFAAVNKSFGFAGQSVVKNAALRMLEYGYKRGWLPPKSKEPIRALNEFFGRLEAMGYADKIHIAKRGEQYVLEVHGLADYDAVHSLREMHYPLLPIFLGEMLVAIIDQYFRLRVTLTPVEFKEQKRGFDLPFSIHEQAQAPEISRLTAMARVDEFEE